MSRLDPPGLDARTTELLATRTAALARRAGTTESQAGGLEVIRLVVGGGAYAIPARAVRAVGALTRFTPVPHAPESVAGLAAAGGRVFPVFYLRAVLGLTLTTLPEYSRLVLLGDEDNPLALIVDAVERVERIDLETLQEPPATVAPAARALLNGVTPDGVALLDPDALLGDPRLVVDITVPSSFDG